MNDSSKTSTLRLSRPPVAIGFFETPPEGVPAWGSQAVPAGCYFWQQAWQGRTFYTTPADHYNCAVGAYVNKIALPEERSGELENTVGFMVENSYLEVEVPRIPTLKTTPKFIAYGPVDSVPFEPDVVVVAASPGNAMVLFEAALKAGISTETMPILGRPGCAVVPLAQHNKGAAMSLGCKGNRTFTGLPDEELYVCIPGDQWEAFTTHIGEVQGANSTMGDYYQSRKTQFCVAVAG